MVVNETKPIKRTNKQIPPLFRIEIYLILLVSIIGGLFWIHNKGKEIADKQQEPIGYSNQSLQRDKQKPQKNSNTRENQPIETPRPAEPKEVNDFGAVGSLNHQYLQSQPFSRLIVEIDYVESTPPHKNSVGTFLSTLKRYVDKPEGVVRSGDNALKAQKDSYSIQDLLNIAKINRSNYSQGNTVSLYVLYVNGGFDQNPGALGVALSSSMFVIFQDKINQAVTSLIFASEIEQAVLNHELGHLFGLVNINYQSSIDHEDANHPNHSKNSGSVMYWVVEDISVANVLRGGPPSQFDDADQEDIAKIKSGA